jgi:hypothetical protein
MNLRNKTDMQTTSDILMIRPVNFIFNKETAVNNVFQVEGSGYGQVQKDALKEFDAFVEMLRLHKINVTVVNDTPEPHTPDSIFPNNWISFHENGKIVLYPMYAHNRRLERKPQLIDEVKQQFNIKEVVDLSIYEQHEQFLEGTGSMVLDRQNKIAYACVSARTNADLFNVFCQRMGYKPILFHAVDKNGRAIYHTNVLMCVADRYIVICLDSIKDPEERYIVRNAIRDSAKEIINISFEQMNHFAGNMLQVNNIEGKKFLVMSTQAFRSLTPEQQKKFKSYNEIIHSPLNTIEKNGGGSARCMMAEVHR